MHINKAKFSFFLIFLLSAFINVVFLSSSVSANNWTGPERTDIACDFPRPPELPRGCAWGPYTLSTQNVRDGFRSIGGFYVNPTHSSRQDGLLPMEYSINGGRWISRDLVYNSGSANYIDFGSGVTSFRFRFTQQPRNWRMGFNTRTTVRFNYDLDR